MRCPNCTADNHPAAKFCIECGAAFSLACAKCGFTNPLNAKFCQDCGTSFKPRTQSPRVASQLSPTRPEIAIADEAASLAPNDIPDGERKTVTALFADIKGSMELMEDLDPEEARAIVDPALKLMIEAVHRYGGYTVQSTGDGIFALFGAPVAHEDHPQRALYAALRMHEAMRHYGERLRADKGLNLQLRIGVNIGEVVVRNIQTGTEHTEYSPIGHSTSLAARLQTLATPGSTVISGNMRGLIEGYFQVKAFGPTRIKGVSEPIEVFEVTGIGPLRTRLQRAAGRGLTKFVGRQREMESLRHAAFLAKEGRGQIVAAVAEPGVGKSRLFYEFKATSATGWMVLEALSISHGKASAYLPVIDLLRNYFKIFPTDDERERREKVAGKITVLDRSLEDTLPYLFNVLGIVEDDPLVQTDGQLKKRRTLEAIKRILLRESLNQPLMVVFEDLHWMDGESEAFLKLLADAIATSRVLLLVNYRPEYSHQWGSKTYYTQLRLDPLGRESADEMLSTLLGSDAGVAPLKRLIAEKTDGNPLFMEEIVLSLFEDGALARNGEAKLAKPLASLRIPSTVQGIIASRIDRLPADEKNLLQTVAVIGSEFSMGVARKVSGKSEDELNRMLGNLQLAEFIYEQPATGDVEYTFKHALTQYVAYNSMLTDRRKLLHERTGEAIETLYPDRSEDHLTELAHHFDSAGNIGKAVEYLSRSGAIAAQQVAHSEALSCITRALELLPYLPEGAGRDRQELELQMALNGSLYSGIGLRAAGREAALLRAQDLSQRLGDNAKLMEVLLVLAQFRASRRDFHAAQKLANTVLVMAQEARSPMMLAGANLQVGAIHFATGQFLAAREHLERSVELFGRGPLHTHSAWLSGAAQIAHSILVGALVILGYPSEARVRADDLVAAGRRGSDFHSIAAALWGDFNHHVLLRDIRSLSQVTEEMLSIIGEHHSVLVSFLGAFVRGWFIAVTGKGEDGIADMRRTLENPMFADALVTPLMLVILAEICGKNGRVEDGIELVAQGLAQAEQTGQRMAEAELYRLKGEFLTIKEPGNVAESERCLLTAIDVARRQGARLFELRATVSLARQLRETNRGDEARAMLADIYNWFTEGFDTADLKDAKTFLEQLGAKQ